jgi:putative oxidoreductase
VYEVNSVVSGSWRLLLLFESQQEVIVMARSNRLNKIVLWSVTTLLAAAFLMFATLKLTGAQQLVAEFIKWGYPTWFRFFVGVAEIGGAVLLLFPRTVTPASVGLGILMAGCVFSHLKAGEGPQSIPALVLLTLLAVVGYARRSYATGFRSQVD